MFWLVEEVCTEVSHCVGEHKFTSNKLNLRPRQQQTETAGLLLIFKGHKSINYRKNRFAGSALLILSQSERDYVWRRLSLKSLHFGFGVSLCLTRSASTCHMIIRIHTIHPFWWDRTSCLQVNQVFKSHIYWGRLPPECRFLSSPKNLWMFLLYDDNLLVLTLHWSYSTRKFGGMFVLMVSFVVSILATCSMLEMSTCFHWIAAGLVQRRCFSLRPVRVHYFYFFLILSVYLRTATTTSQTEKYVKALLIID